MNLETFQDLVDRCGERSDDWPADIRAEALRLVAASADAQAIVAEAKMMRELLAQPLTIRAPEGMANRIFALADGIEEPRPAMNKALRHERIRARGTERTAAAGRTPEAPATGWVPPQKMYMWLGAVFLSGVAFGVGGALANGAAYIDFASLFAVLS